MPTWQIDTSPIRRSSLDTEYVRRLVTSTSAGAAYNPTADVVALAFTPLTNPLTNPVTGDWKTGSWETVTNAGSFQYYARALVGPAGGAITLTVGDWQIWAKITDSPETPVLAAGILTLT